MRDRALVLGLAAAAALLIGAAPAAAQSVQLVPFGGQTFNQPYLRDRRSRGPQPGVRGRGRRHDSPGQGRGHPGHPLPGHQQRRLQGTGCSAATAASSRWRSRPTTPRAASSTSSTHGLRRQRGVRPAHRGVPPLGRQPRCRRSRQPANRARDSAREQSGGDEPPPQRRPAAVRTRRPPLHLRRRWRLLRGSGRQRAEHRHAERQAAANQPRRHDAGPVLDPRRQPVRGGHARARTRSTPMGCATPTASHSIASPGI